MSNDKNAATLRKRISEYLNRPLLHFDGNPWTIGNAVEGLQIFGGIGSGKTSGSGRFLAIKYLRAGFGGLVLTVKADEKELWDEYCRLTGRTDDLIIVEPKGRHAFNFLESAGAETANIVQILQTVIRASEEKASGAGQDPFWETALSMLTFHVVDLCKLAYGAVTVEQMYDIAQSLPREGQTKETVNPNNAYHKALAEAEAKVAAQMEKWEDAQSPDELDRCRRDNRHYNMVLATALPDARLFHLVKNFFEVTYARLSERTRSIIDFSLTGFLFRLLREPAYSLFCQGTSTFTPEDCLTGKIIVLNLPTMLHHKIGQDCQILFKYIWQRFMERRRISDVESIRAVFLWADEAQVFLHEYDASYQATARSNMIATVYLSQNLPNYLASMGGVKSDFRVKSFLGTLGTKIFHANGDLETNKYSSELIGDGFFEESSTSSGMSREFSASRSRHLKISRVVRPEAFFGLKTGGERNKFWVSAYVHFQGNVLKNGENFTPTKFHQKYPEPTDKPS